MTPEEPFDEIGELLRGRKPDPRPSAGLEKQILLALRQRAPRAERRAWFRPWFVLPPALAMAASLAVVAVMLPRPGSAPETAGMVPAALAPEEVETPLLPAIEPALPHAGSLGPLAWAALIEDHPLEMEVRAIQRDADRARRFLIDCLPSLSMAAD